jgi:hypothetical protein
MTVDSSLVDRIVHGVLQQMQAPAGGQRPAPSAAPAKGGQEQRLTQQVAGMLEEQASKGVTAILVSPRAVITPAAVDVLRSRKLAIRREVAPASSPMTASKLLVIVVRNTPVVERLCRQKPWRRELLGCPDDAAKLATSALTRGEVERVIVFAAQTHRAACLANRHTQVKAVAVSSQDDLRGALDTLRVNVLCIDPTNRGDFEVGRLVETFEKHVWKS